MREPQELRLWEGQVGERGAYHFSEAVTYSLGLAPAHRLIKDIQIALVDL